MAQIWDQLAAIAKKVDETKLINVALNGFTKSLDPFVKGVCTQENFPNGRGFGMTVSKKRLKRSQRLSRQGDGEENLALVSFGQEGQREAFQG